MTNLPHDPYARTVMDALAAESLLEPADSWTEYASDDGEVMLMDIVITLDRERAVAAGLTHGVVIQWNQTRGWDWGPLKDNGHAQYIEPLITGTVVPDPADIVRAATILLDGDDARGRVPVAGSARPAAQTITSTLQAVMDEDGIEDEMARELSAYA